MGKDPSYRECFAARTRGMIASEIRALLAVASRPEIVSLAGGMPTADALPMEALGRLLAEVVADRGHVALQYGSSQGDPELREQICEVMRVEGIEGHPDDVVVTVGSQQALDLITQIMVDPGDVVLTESPAYVGALATFAAHQAEVRHVAGDENGLLPEALVAAIVRVERSGRSPKLLYTVPNFGNPSGVTLGERRRHEITAVCRRAGLLVVEDNPYGLLRLDGRPLPALREADPGVIYLGSFSKILAPGVRVGWALAPPPIATKLVLAVEAAMLSHSNLGQLAVARYLAREPWTEHIKAVRELYWERREAMLAALDAEMPPGTRWRRPDGGFFVWLGLPQGLDSKAMLPRAIDAGVAYVPGTGFFADGSGRGHLRLSFSYPDPDAIALGVARLAGVVAHELEEHAKQ